jgi:hypothetical protein
VEPQSCRGMRVKLRNHQNINANNPTRKETRFPFHYHVTFRVCRTVKSSHRAKIVLRGMQCVRVGDVADVIALMHAHACMLSNAVLLARQNKSIIVIIMPMYSTNKKHTQEWRMTRSRLCSTLSPASLPLRLRSTANLSCRLRSQVSCPRRRAGATGCRASRGLPGPETAVFGV